MRNYRLILGIIFVTASIIGLYNLKQTKQERKQPVASHEEVGLKILQPSLKKGTLTLLAQAEVNAKRDLTLQWGLKVKNIYGQEVFSKIYPETFTVKANENKTIDFAEFVDNINGRYKVGFYLWHVDKKNQPAWLNPQEMETIVINTSLSDLVQH